MEYPVLLNKAKSLVKSTQGYYLANPDNKHVFLLQRKRLAEELKELDDITLNELLKRMKEDGYIRNDFGDVIKFSENFIRTGV